MRVPILLILAALVPACGGSGGGGPAYAPLAVYIEGDELFAVDAGGLRVPLSGNLDHAGWRARVVKFVWSPDRERVAFTADHESPGWFQLFVAPANGGVPERVSPDDVVLQDPALAWQWSPDGRRLAFQARRPDGPGANGWTELYVWDGAAVRICAPMTLNGTVPSFAWAPDGSRVAYYANPAADADYRIFTVRPDGTGHSAVSGSSAVWSPGPWSFDAGHLAWWAHDGFFKVYTLRAARADGSEVATIGSHPYGNGPVRFTWSPTASHLAYQNFEDNFNGSDVYTVRPDGSGKVKLSPSGADAFRVLWAPDGHRVSFYAAGFWVCGPAGENPVKVARTSGDWSPDSHYLAVGDALDTAGVVELYVVRPDGTSTTKVSGPMIPGGDVDLFEWSPGGTRIAWLADAEIDQVFELYCGNRDGTGRVKVSDGGAVAGWHWTSDGGSIVLRSGGLLRLSRADGTSPTTLTPTGPVTAFAVR